MLVPGGGTLGEVVVGPSFCEEVVFGVHLLGPSFGEMVDAGVTGGTASGDTVVFVVVHGGCEVVCTYCT